MSSEIWFRLLESTVIPLTPELAQQFHEMPASPTERELSGLRMRHLREKIVAGLAVTFHWASAQVDGKELRMNGNHSSGALLSLNGSFPEKLVVNLERYEVPNYESLGLLFRQFDDRKSSRTPADVSGAYQGLYADLQEVPRKVAKRGILGVNWYEKNVLGSPVPLGDDVYVKFAEANYHAYLRWLGDTISMKTPEMNVDAVCAAMFGTFITNETPAREFWAAVARGGVEFDETAPATTLDTWLKDQKDTANCKHPVKPLDIYQGCIFAWTAFREGQAIKTIKSDTKKGIHEIVR